MSWQEFITDHRCSSVKLIYTWVKSFFVVSSWMCNCTQLAFEPETLNEYYYYSSMDSFITSLAFLKWLPLKKDNIIQQLENSCATMNTNEFIVFASARKKSCCHENGGEGQSSWAAA